MKSFFLIIRILLLLLTVLCMSFPSLAMAYDPKKDLVSAIDLKATGLMVKKTYPANETAKEGSPSREVSIPVNDGLSTYVDCSAPSRQDPTRETAKDFRTVFGFHFVLK